MSKTNATEDRVHSRDFCGPEILTSHCTDNRCLVVCDCEGYERVLIDTRFAHAYAGCDFIIEIHDFIHSDIGFRI